MKRIKVCHERLVKRNEIIYHQNQDPDSKAALPRVSRELCEALLVVGRARLAELARLGAVLHAQGTDLAVAGRGHLKEEQTYSSLVDR